MGNEGVIRSITERGGAAVRVAERLSKGVIEDSE